MTKRTNPLWVLCVALAMLFAAPRARAELITFAADAFVDGHGTSPPPGFDGTATFSYDLAGLHRSDFAGVTTYTPTGLVPISMILTLGSVTYDFTLPGSANSMSFTILTQTPSGLDQFELFGSNSTTGHNLRFSILGFPDMIDGGDITSFDPARIATTPVFLISFSSSDFYFGSFQNLHRVDPAAVPEPSSLLLLGIGALGLVGAGLKRRTDRPNP